MAPCAPSHVAEKVSHVSPELAKLTQFAGLFLAMQLHDHDHAYDLGGCQLSVDEHGPLLSPNSARNPTSLAVSSAIPAGVTVGAVMALIGDDMQHPDLARAFGIMLSAKLALEAARLRCSSISTPSLQSSRQLRSHALDVHPASRAAQSAALCRLFQYMSSKNLYQFRVTYSRIVLNANDLNFYRKYYLSTARGQAIILVRPTSSRASTKTILPTLPDDEARNARR